MLYFSKNVDKYIKVNNDNYNKKNEFDLNKEIEELNSKTILTINILIVDFYKNISKEESDILVNILNINNNSSQNAKVLVLLLADKNIKRTNIPYILGVYGNLNPVISRLINSRIKPNIDKIAEMKTNISIFTLKIQDLIK